MNKKKLSTASLLRIEEFMKLFSGESEEIRTVLASSLPAYNKLLSLHAKTFEEFALLPFAREQEVNYRDPLFDYTQIKPVCIKCGEKKNIRRVDKNKYICNRCGKKYSANNNSISSGTNVSSIVWMQVLMCMLDFYSVKKTCEFCGISTSTFYLIRNKLFYGMQLMLNDLKLYGVIQVDHTFTRISFKGMDLDDTEYPEDSPFDNEDFIPRPARKRGGSYSYDEKNMNQMCIFTAIDEYGHSMTKFVGIGAASTGTLLRNIDENKFLHSVPAEDPFLWMHPHKIQVQQGVHESTGDNEKKTLIISDKEQALVKYGQRIGIPVEAHVYRRKGKEVRLSKKEHNIQRVNNLHKKLKEFLRKTNYVSSKYLPGYLTFFDFIENTGATQEAVGQLFEILARPGFGMSVGYFKELFSVPNYMIEWSNEDNPIRKFPYNQLYACYLYGKYRKEAENGKVTLTVKEIAEQTNYSPSSVRRNYKNFSSSGLLDDINAFFEKGEKELIEKRKHIVKSNQRFKPEILAVYDEYCVFREELSTKKITIKAFFELMNKKYGLNYSFSMWKYWCSEVSKSGVRSSLPALAGYRKEDLVLGYSKKQQQYFLEFAEIFEKYRMRMLSMGKNPVSVTCIYREIAKDKNLSEHTVASCVIRGNCIRRELEVKKLKILNKS